MKPTMGTSGLIFNEPLLWEKGKKGRCGASLPRRDVNEAPIARKYLNDGLDLPDLSEIDVVRHYTRLSGWNFGVDTGMYPLGSCTMKYNPKINEAVAALPGFSNAHPLLPSGLSQGILRMMHELERHLAEITGMSAVTLQPAAGAHGELTGMLLMHAYHTSKGNPRSKIIVPDTAHGTNPASAALCKYQPVPVTSNSDGILDPSAIADIMDEETAGIMVTNPNTLGLFETHIQEIASIVHKKGGIVYCDGANMNAVMGIVRMGDIGVDLMHLNLHKTFSTPHGGGGPGSGPVAVQNFLEPFLPVPRVIKKDGIYSLSDDCPQSIGKIHAFYGNVGVMLKAYAYILTMGGPYLKKASQLAVLNANYVKESLKDIYDLPYDRPCMHECVFSDRNFVDNKVTTLDIAKRLIDYGFHPPTVYFPLVVHGAIMIEPTETESRDDIDQFIAAMKSIAEEAQADPAILHNAPQVTKVRRLDETLAARKPCLTG